MSSTRKQLAPKGNVELRNFRPVIKGKKLEQMRIDYEESEIAFLAIAYKYQLSRVALQQYARYHEWEWKKLGSKGQSTRAVKAADSRVGETQRQMKEEHQIILNGLMDRMLEARTKEETELYKSKIDGTLAILKAERLNAGLPDSYKASEIQNNVSIRVEDILKTIDVTPRPKEIIEVVETPDKVLEGITIEGNI